MFKKVTEEVYTDVGEEESYTKDSFRHVADRLNLSSEEFEAVFAAVDSDDDGVITKKDLCAPSPRSTRKNPTTRERLPSLSSNDTFNTDLGVLSERK